MPVRDFDSHVSSPLGTRTAEAAHTFGATCDGPVAPLPIDISSLRRYFRSDALHGTNEAMVTRLDEVEERLRGNTGRRDHPFN